jgi:uncharacterized phage-associated protein
MIFRFDLKKTLQAAAVLLRHERTRTMSFLRLLKLLYIADRESIRDTGRPITGDRVLAMKHGPVLTGVYDLIRGQHVRAPRWAHHIDTEGYLAVLRHDPGVGELSRGDIARLEELARRFDDWDDWRLVELTHQFPEWLENQPGDAAKPISHQDIVKAVGRGDDLDAIVQDEVDRAAFDRLFEEA